MFLGPKVTPPPIQIGDREDPALARRFQPVYIDEPDMEDAIAILRGLKERYEVHGGGVSAVIEDFRTLEVFAEGRQEGGRAWLKTDKGHAAEWNAFHEAAEMGGKSPIAWPEIRATMLSVFAAKESLRSGLPTRIPS